MVLWAGKNGIENDRGFKEMRILIDINHPAHVHLFRNFFFEMKKKGNELFVTVKDIPSAKDLLDKYNITYFNIGTKSDSLKKKIWNQIQYNISLFRFVRKHKINIGLGTSVTLAQVSRVTRMKSFVFDDDDSVVQPLFVKFAHPFADYIITPSCLKFEEYGKKHIVYPGYHELAYLHPERFRPEPNVLKKIGLKEKDIFFIMRFNSFKAHHDMREMGLTLLQKQKLIKMLDRYGRVLVTTERESPEIMKKYMFNASSETMHSFIFYAKMLIGDSQTMISEAAVLGTPAIRCNSFVDRISYLKEEEHKYGLTYGFKPNQFNLMMKKIEELLEMPNLKADWQLRRQKMLAEKIDVTAFMVWLIENYPGSIEILKKDPDYPNIFK